MRNPKWTPGPWKAQRGNDDAHLIAAAQELYAALEAIAELDDGDQRFVWQHPEEFEKAHAALAKARGESQ